MLYRPGRSVQPLLDTLTDPPNNRARLYGRVECPDNASEY
jgi:hypothetical protein